MKKSDDETLVDYARKFANAKDVWKSLRGRMIFQKLIESLEKCNLWNTMVKNTTKLENINANQKRVYVGHIKCYLLFWTMKYMIY